MKINIATYNIAAGLSDGLFKSKNYYKAADVIREIDAGIISLNEVGKPLPPSISHHTEFLAEYCGYRYYRFANAVTYGNAPYGNAILSKFPIVSSTVIPIKRFVRIAPGIYEPRCLLVTEIMLDKPLRVITTHLGLMPDERKLGIIKAEEIIRASDMPTVFMGDFNLTPQDKMLDPIKQLLKDTSNPLLKTYPANNPKRKLDHIFVSKNITVKNVSVVKKVASDHLPIVAEIMT